MHRNAPPARSVVASLLVAATLTLCAARPSGLPAAPGPSAGLAQAGRPSAPAARPRLTRTAYIEYARAAADSTWDRREQLLARWRETFDPDTPFGYRAPGGLLEAASIYAFLHEREKNPVYADRAKQILLTYGDYRRQFPEAVARRRPDYGHGVPALPDFFVVMRYLRAFESLHRLGQLTPAEAATAEGLAAHSIEYLLQTSEWGTMNRTMLRAEALAWAVKAMPHHPRAAAWDLQRRALGDDNWGNWEIEDATIYHGVWLYALLGYADAVGRFDELLRTPEMYYYAHYFLNLLCPAGFVPDFGDANWQTNWQHFLVFFEAAAARFGDGQMQWAAEQVATRFLDPANPTSASLGCFLIDAWRWGRDDLTPAPPRTASAEVMEDVQGKKIVFRNGWQPDSSYLLLNYRDEGDGGLNFRDYLRDSIPVEEEKMTHGHADENSIALLMSRGSVLLHDAGYRDYMPSGPYGAYRQDYFHNRLCVRPEKIWMGQQASERRYSRPGPIPRQGLLEFLRNAGSYRPVRTRKVDFLSLPDFDYSRTRILDDGWGYDADRIVVYLRDPEAFVVFDVFKARTDEFFTLANMWHTRRITSRGDHWYDTMYDTIAPAAGAQGAPLPAGRRLLVVFPHTHFRLEGVEPITRHYQEELAIHQVAARHFEPAHTEGLVTVLIPHDADQAPEALARRITAVPTDPEGAGLAVRIQSGDRQVTVGIKQDLRRDIARDERRPRYLYEKGRVGYGALETDGDLVVASESGGGLAYTVVNMTRAQRGEKVLFQNGPSFKGMRFDGGADASGIDKVRYWRDRVRLDAVGAR